MNFASRLQHVEEYYFSKKLKEVHELSTQGKPIVNMGIGSPDLPPPTDAVEALQHFSNQDKAHQYQSYQGIPELRQAFSNFYKQHYKVTIDSNSEVLPLMGSKEGIMHISMAFLNAGDEVLIPAPGYPTYTSVTRLLEAVPRYYTLEESKGWLPDIKNLSAQDLSKVKLMWVNYPHMPTGSCIDVSGFQSLIDFAKKYDILIVNDNPYSFILNDDPLSIFSVQGAKDVALELHSLSKTFNMSGWRVGAVFGNSLYIKTILKVKSNMDSGMFYPVQMGAVAALNSNVSWFENINTIYRRRRNLVFEIADRLRCSYNKNSAGLFVWCRLPDKSPSSISVVDTLLYDKAIFITPGSIFGKAFDNYVRFSLCVDESEIKKALERL